MLACAVASVRPAGLRAQEIGPKLRLSVRPPRGTSISAAVEGDAAARLQFAHRRRDRPGVDDPSLRVLQLGADLRHALDLVGLVGDLAVDGEQFVAALQPPPVGLAAYVERADRADRDADALAEVGQAEELDARAPRRSSAAAAAIATIVHSLAGLRRGRTGSAPNAAPPASGSAAGSRQERRRRLVAVQGRGGGGGAGGAAVLRSSGAGSCTQEKRQLAQRTFRPVGPIALSGTT